MAVASPVVGAVAKHVFWAPDDDRNDADIDVFEEDLNGVHDEKPTLKKNRSMYVIIFEDMLQTVLTAEHFLFDIHELRCFDDYTKLSDEAKYLFVRLCLRKADRWIRESDLKYQREIGNNIPNAMKELCSHTSTVEVKAEEREVIDLSFDGDEPVAGPSKESMQPPPVPMSAVPPDYHAFAEDDSRAELRELLDCLKRDELQKMVKDMNLKSKGHTKEAFINTLIIGTSTQSTLSLLPIKAKGKGKMPEHFKQTTIDWFTKGRRTTQQDRLREMVMKKLGSVIRLNSDVIKLFRRVNMVYFRSTLYVPGLMTAAILARAKKRTYATYVETRTPNIWSTRQELLDYEEVIDIEARIDELAGGLGGSARARSRSVASRTPVPTFASPLKKVKGEEGETRFLPDASYVLGDGDGEKESMRVQDAKEVKAIFEKWYDRWKKLVAQQGNEEGRKQGLERFHCGHVLTRIVCKGAEALGILKDHDTELEVLEELLKQRRWRRGRRGKWYERRALILMTHMEKEQHVYRRAYEGIWEALADEDTHIVYRPKLRRRLVTLEKKLKLPEEERHFCQAAQNKAEETHIEGERIHLAFDESGKIVQSKPKKKMDEKQQVLSFTQANISILSSKESVSEMDVKPNTRTSVMTGKSIWRGEQNEEVTVEKFALQHYNRLGYKGYHCEGRIITTLFGLLCWDIIFASVDGAFETPYQSAPLDIAEDTFFYSREKIARERLKELADAKKDDVAKMVDEAYTTHEMKMCIGVRWDLFTKDDLVGIAKSIGGKGLAIICQLLCEDYSGRTAGVPDLIIWNSDESSCKFVEVKGPGDNLQENQKVWIDVLLQANIPTEVCHVAEKGASKPKKAGKAKAGKTTAGRKRKHEEVEMLVESEDEPEQDYSKLDAKSAVPEGERVLSQPPIPPSTPSTPRTPRKLKVEVLITTPSPSSCKRPRALSPEV